MSKKVLIISSSMRKDGNSETLAKEFEKGAKETENEVEMIYLRDYEIGFCKGCMACQKLNKCIIKDDTTELMEKVRTADILAFVTPIYYYAVCGQLKTFLDRMNLIYAAGHNFKEVYLLASAADGADSAMDGAIKDLEGWICCFDGVKLAGVVKGTNSDSMGDILKHTDKLKEAYNMGRNL